MRMKSLIAGVVLGFTSMAWADLVPQPRWTWERIFKTPIAFDTYETTLKDVPHNKFTKTVEGDAEVKCFKSTPIACTIKANGEYKKNPEDDGVKWEIELLMSDEYSDKMYLETLAGEREFETRPPQKIVAASFVISCSKGRKKTEYNCVVNLEGKDSNEPQ